MTRAPTLAFVLWAIFVLTVPITTAETWPPTYPNPQSSSLRGIDWYADWVSRVYPIKK